MTFNHHIKPYLCPTVQYSAACKACANTTKPGSGSWCGRAMSVGCCRAGVHAAVCVPWPGARAGMLPSSRSPLRSRKQCKNLTAKETGLYWVSQFRTFIKWSSSRSTCTFSLFLFCCVFGFFSSADNIISCAKGRKQCH